MTTTSYVDRFREMRRQWERLDSARVEQWIRTMRNMSAHQQRLVREGLWLSGPSDLMAIMRRERDELAHTYILRWLLDPMGRHRLGTAVVERLVAHCGGDTDGDSVAVRRVDASYKGKGREADIVVWGRSFTLVIEIKVDADEQRRQCEDLFKNFRREVGPLFLFLTPDGRRPRTAYSPEARRAFKVLSWRQVHEMIECAALDAPTGAVESYLPTLKEQFG